MINKENKADENNSSAKKMYISDKYSKMKNIDWEEAQRRRATTQEIKSCLFQNEELVERQSSASYEDSQRTSPEDRGGNKLKEKANEPYGLSVKLGNMGQQAQKEHPFGTCISDLYNHSWSCRINKWVWVPKGRALVATDLGLGFQARSEEIKRFRGQAKKIVRIKKDRGTDNRLFVEVVSGSTMYDRDGQPSYAGFQAG